MFSARISIPNFGDGPRSRNEQFAGQFAGIAFSILVILAGLAGEVWLQKSGREDVRLRIISVSSALVRVDARGGMAALAAEIRELQRESTLLRFGLRAADGRLLFDGSLHAAGRLGWFEYAQGSHARLALLRQLPGARVVSVSGDLTAETAPGVEVARIVAGIGGTALIAMLLITFNTVGATGRALESVTRSLAIVKGGDFSTRLIEDGQRGAIAVISRHVNAMLAAIERHNKELQTAMQAIAHELRTPLSHIVSQLEIVNDPETAEPAKSAALARIALRLDYVSKSYDAILRLSHVETTQKPSTQIVNVAQRVAAIADAYSAAFADAGREIQLELLPAQILGEPELISIAAATLLENVISHTPAGTRVRITSQTQNGNVLLRFADNGPGIEQSEREKVKMRFYRGPKSAGLGLGLSFVEAVVRRAGGTLELSDARPGLAVVMSFPDPSSKWDSG